MSTLKLTKGELTKIILEEVRSLNEADEPEAIKLVAGQIASKLGDMSLSQLTIVNTAIDNIKKGSV
tara:strand:+ start:5169 stop:5366 length:198 start_codon:yes stop_codon:yes gene_type:complete